MSNVPQIWNAPVLNQVCFEKYSCNILYCELSCHAYSLSLNKECQAKFTIGILNLAVVSAILDLKSSPGELGQIWDLT